MRHRKKNLKLHCSKGHREALLRNLAVSLILKEKIKTTHIKAEMVSSFFERAMSKTLNQESVWRRKQNLHQILNNSIAEDRLLSRLVVKYRGKRKSGFTRIIKIGPRVGDGANISQLELV